MTLLVLPLLALALGAAGVPPQLPAPDAAQRAFFAKLSSQCGATYEGAASVTPGGPGDLFAGRKLVFHLASCTADEIRIPFAVDDNRSRTIIIRYDSSGLSIKHDHRHADGTPDADTMYGGTGVNGGSALVQSFKADPYTVAANPLRLTNVWIMSLSEDGQTVTYGVDRFDKPLYRSTLRKGSHSAAARPPNPAKPSPTVIVQDNKGTETKGKLLRLDVREAVLMIDGEERRFSLADVRRIEKRGDSLKNGAVKGALFGLVGGFLGSRLGRCEPPKGSEDDATCKQEDNPHPVAFPAAVALVWAGIGAGSDALIVGRTTLYQAPTGTAALELGPTSVALRVRW